MKFLPESLPRVLAMSRMSASGKLKSVTISLLPSPVSLSTLIRGSVLCSMTPPGVVPPPEIVPLGLTVPAVGATPPAVALWGWPPSSSSSSSKKLLLPSLGALLVLANGLVKVLLPGANPPLAAGFASAAQLLCESRARMPTTPIRQAMPAAISSQRSSEAGSVSRSFAVLSCLMVVSIGISVRP